MGYFNRDTNNRSSGSRSFGGNRSFGPKRSFGGARGGARPQMHDTVCANCGAACKVPFTPTGDRPLYCKDCFAKMGGGEKRFDRQDAPKQFKKFDAPRESGPSKADFDALNAKVDKILAILTDAMSAADEEELEEEQIVEEAPVEKKKRTSKKAEVAADIKV